MENIKNKFIYQLYINSTNKQLEEKWNVEPIEITSSLSLVIGDFIDINLEKYRDLENDFKSTRFKVIERTLIMHDQEFGETIYLEIQPYSENI